MLPTWKVRRVSQPLPTAHRQQDCAYQLLLRWSLAGADGPLPTSAPTLTTEEVSDANRPVCPGVHSAPSTGANY